MLVYSSGTVVTSIGSSQAAAISAICTPIHPSWTPKQRVATIFMGELRASNGLRRLVTVEAGVEWTPGRDTTVTFFTTSSGVGWSNAVRGNCHVWQYRWGFSVMPPSPEAVIYSATTDPNDPSHISFRCSLFDVSDIWNGYLGSDGNFVLNTTPSSKK